MTFGHRERFEFTEKLRFCYITAMDVSRTHQSVEIFDKDVDNLVANATSSDDLDKKRQELKVRVFCVLLNLIWLKE